MRHSRPGRNGGSAIAIRKALLRRMRASSTSNIHPNVDVWMPTEKPEHVLALQLPDIPHVVGAEVQVAIERKREAIHAAALLDVAQGFVNVFTAEGQEQIGQYFLNRVLLVAACLSHR